jgi:ABC-type dipeptide/oligopeptide/nickel transport system permease subunit
VMVNGPASTRSSAWPNVNGQGEKDTAIRGSDGFGRDIASRLLYYGSRARRAGE